VAANNENFVSGVNGEAGGRFAGRERPGVFDFESLRVEFDEGTLVLEVDEDFAFPSDAPNSGPPPRGKVLTTFPEAASMADAVLASPLKVKTRFENGS